MLTLLLFCLNYYYLIKLLILGARRTFLSAKSNDQIDSFKMELVNILYDHAGIREVPESKLFNAIMLGNVGVGTEILLLVM